MPRSLTLSARGPSADQLVLSTYPFDSSWLWLTQGFGLTWTLQSYLGLKVAPEVSLLVPVCTARSPILVSRLWIPEGNLMDMAHLFMVVQVTDFRPPRMNYPGINFLWSVNLGWWPRVWFHPWRLELECFHTGHSRCELAHLCNNDLKPSSGHISSVFLFLITSSFIWYLQYHIFSYFSFVTQTTNSLRSETLETELQES